MAVVRNTKEVEPEIIEADQQIDAGLLHQASLKFLRWAHDHNLLTADAFFPGSEYENPKLANATADGILLLRAKQIRAVGINTHTGIIYVFLNRAAPGVRQQLTLPAECEGFPLRYLQGQTETIAPGNIAQAASPCAVHVAKGSLFYTCGSSISVGNARGAGTLGCIVKDAAGQLYGLSNNHVAGGCNYAPFGLPILAPGVIDVSPHAPKPFTLGLHSRQLPMMIGDPTTVDTTANQDAALFQIVNDTVSSMQQNFYDTPATSMALAPGMRIMKVGRSSGLTVGVVRAALTGPTPIHYSANEYNFNGHVYFDNMYLATGIDDRFSEAGDSGSLVVHETEDGSLHAVGIVVGGTASNTVPGGLSSLIMPIEPILRLLQVELVSNHNV